jgi:DHA1 family bicyclomycin/chloramphenicol resistance-like MFS transporter
MRTEPDSARRIAVLVAFMTMLAPFSIDTYLPSFPDIAAEFGATHVQMQQTMSLYLLAFAAMTLVYGPLADTFGRRIVMLGAIGLYGVASIGCALSGSIGELILFRVAQGLTASAGFVVGRAIVRDAFAGVRAQKVMSNIMLMFAVAPALAPIIGGYLHDAFGWRSVFWFLALLGGALWLLVYRRLPETLSPEHRQSIHPVAVGRIYGRALSTGGFMVLVSMIALNFGGMFLYVAGAPVVVYEHLGMRADDFAVVFVPLVTGIMLGAFISGRLAGRTDMLRSVALGYGFMAMAVLFNLTQAHIFPGHPALVVAPITLYAFGNAVAVPSLSLLALEYFPHNRGMASAAQGFVHTASNAAVAGALVPLVSHTIPGMAFGMMALHVTSLILWLGWLRATRAET